MSIRSLTAIGALGLCLVFSAAVAAPPTPRPSRCENGILRWTDDGTEVALFGVNYYAPFSMDWQALRRHHVDPAEALRTDLVHLRRLGLDALRLHCWDREISDPQGNLVDNDHLRLLDLLISEAANQGLYVVLTPIAWWGGADPATNGFSNRFSMQQMTTDAEARACQVRYLAQFMAHANRFTGLRYADDPRIVAIELINEPIYPPNTSDDAVVEYINTLAAAVRGTGCSKPVLYNCWGSREQAAARSTPRRRHLRLVSHRAGFGPSHHRQPPARRRPPLQRPYPLPGSPGQGGLRIRCGRRARHRHVPSHGPRLPQRRCAGGDAVPV
jgi:hypothetical protein